MPTPFKVAERLRADGYALLKDAILPDVTYQLRDLVYGELERLGEGTRVLTAVDQKHLARGEFPLAVRLKPDFLAVAHEAVVVDVLRCALGSDELRVHLPPMVRFKTPGHKPGDVPLHQDCSYNAHLNQFITVWVPLCDITEACGGVDVMPGSHRVGALDHHEQAVWNNCIDERSLAERGLRFAVTHVTMKIGDALLFGPYTLHRSHPNTSATTRCSIDYRFFPRNVATSKHCYDLATRMILAPTEAAA